MVYDPATHEYFCEVCKRWFDNGESCYCEENYESKNL